jgi:hypothetical protein
MPESVTKFPAFYVTQKFITAFKWSHYLSTSWARLIQPTTFYPVSILFSNLRRGLSSGLIHSCVPYQNPVRISLHDTCYMPRLSHSSWFDHPNNMWWWVQTIKLLAMTISPIPCHLVPLRAKFLPQDPILEHPQSMFRPPYDPHSQTYKTTGKIIVL